METSKTYTQNKLRVRNLGNYTPFKYPAYFNGFDPVESPMPGEIFEVGDVVVCDEDGAGNLSLGVVLGCIDRVHGELRTDACGMIPMEHVRHAKLEDFELLKIRKGDKLYREICNGEAIHYDWSKNQISVTQN